MTAPVTVHNLAKTFYDEARGEVQAVGSVSFECRAGEIFGLLGANGAGKTTTLRILATILKPTAGSAAVMGHDVLAEPEAVRASLGFSSSTTALYPRLTARETLEFFARINGCSAAQTRERVARLIQRCGIQEYADARVDKLSQGKKQKVAIERTVVRTWKPSRSAATRQFDPTNPDPPVTKTSSPLTTPTLSGPSDEARTPDSPQVAGSATRPVDEVAAVEPEATGRGRCVHPQPSNLAE